MGALFLAFNQTLSLLLCSPLCLGCCAITSARKALNALFAEKARRTSSVHAESVLRKTKGLGGFVAPWTCGDDAGCLFDPSIDCDSDRNWSSSRGVHQVSQRICHNEHPCRAVESLLSSFLLLSSRLCRCPGRRAPGTILREPRRRQEGELALSVSQAGSSAAGLALAHSCTRRSSEGRRIVGISQQPTQLAPCPLLRGSAAMQTRLLHLPRLPAEGSSVLPSRPFAREELPS